MRTLRFLRAEWLELWRVFRQLTFVQVIMLGVVWGTVMAGIQAAVRAI